MPRYLDQRNGYEKGKVGETDMGGMKMRIWACVHTRAELRIGRYQKKGHRAERKAQRKICETKRALETEVEGRRRGSRLGDG